MGYLGRHSGCLVLSQGKTTSHRDLVMSLSVQLVDYVIVHELTHLSHPHHDAEFWACVDRALPDWRDRKDELQRDITRHIGFGG